MNGVKANYDRRTKEYVVETVVIEAGNVIAALNSGFMVYDDRAKAIECAARMSHWKLAARMAVIKHLQYVSR